jgi:Trk-type K+ transport system membrane component
MNRKRQENYLPQKASGRRFYKEIPLWISLITMLVVVYDFGFDQSDTVSGLLEYLYVFTLIIGIVSTALRYYYQERHRWKVMVWDSMSVFFMFMVLLAIISGNAGGGDLWYFSLPSWINTALFLVFLREFSALRIDYKRKLINPAQLFILSFLSIILIGSFLLMLPRATHYGISFIDALFTSTSAVCVTGLIVVDTATYFTRLGQSIIIVLIQVGGLGIMTFASYFSYFFRGGSSYENHFVVSALTQDKKIGEAFHILKVIILVTFLIESIGAVFIYFTLDKTLIPLVSERIFFSVFHSISGFCNAGFSTLTHNLYEGGFRFNYSLHLILASLFIIGGLGFPIAYNLVKTLRQLIKVRVYSLLSGKQFTYTPWLLNLNTRIVLITSLILTVSGTLLLFIFEYHNTLQEHGFVGKLITAFFSATSPRTAGFNTVDMALVSFPAIMIIFLLMWIGASPASTGGGIKTSTFAIATLNFLSLAKGKNRIEIFHREIADISVRRAFAIISLSLVVIGGGTFCIAFFDSEKDLLSIAFECFSAYSTVGLSVGVTSHLSTESKMVVIMMMFIGRVSMLTILIALLRQVDYKAYRYPTDEILIN